MTDARVLHRAPVGAVCTLSNEDKYVKVLGGSWRLLGNNGRPRMNVEAKAGIDLAPKTEALRWLEYGDEDSDCGSDS